MVDADAKRREERIKLLATAISNVGVASFIAGVIGPAAVGKFQMLTGAIALASGIVLHFVAQLLLHYVVDAPVAGIVDELRTSETMQ